MDATESPRATLPISANNDLAKPSPPPYVIGIIIVGIFLVGVGLCWCCLWQRRTKVLRPKRPANWNPRSLEVREETISLHRARIQEDIHGRHHDDPKRAKMMHELRKGSKSPTVLHRTPTLHSVHEYSPIPPPKLARIHSERHLV
ncbi:hypothetical protein NMY22_g5152 [Coprinellus aureogranulatus]|nr:hypothetical protein NMY22_g5152 [Coprinellus aureogranulatus]